MIMLMHNLKKSKCRWKCNRFSKPRSSEILTTFKIREAQTRGFVKADREDLEYFLNPENFKNSKKGMLQFLRIDNYKGGITVNELNSFLNSNGGTSGVFYNKDNHL